MVLDVLMQRQRDKRATRRLLRKPPKCQRRAPRIMITDKPGSYSAASSIAGTRAGTAGQGTRTSRRDGESDR